MRVVRLATAILGDASAEDVAQEAIYQAYFEVERLRQPGSFGSWLCGIAVNLAKMSLRRRRVHVSLEDLDGGQFHPTEVRDDPAIAYETLELRERVGRARELLSPEMQAAVWLHYVEGLTYQEIAAITGISSRRWAFCPSEPDNACGRTWRASSTPSQEGDNKP
jgi:RNA polymerase sigma factor (sigma-70 family)